MAMKKCPVCGVSVKVENLERHVKNQHPKEQVDLSEALTEEDRRTIKEQKTGGSSGLTRGGRRLLVAATVVVAAVIVIAVLVSFTVPSPVNPGNPAPNWTLTSTDGVTITLSAWRGAPVLIEFMDVDCPYCQQEAPVLASIYPNYSGQGVHFVSIDINFEGQADTAARIASFQATYNTPWPYCLDPNGLNGVAKAYGTSSTPTSFIINKDGTVNTKIVGAQPVSSFVSALNSALGV
jgi:peroxiredoxin